MKLTKEHLKLVQIEQFYAHMNVLKAEEDELSEHFNVARNLACSKWEHVLIPTSSGGRTGLRVTRILPETMKLLRENFDKQLEEISYRRYAIIKAYYPIVKPLLGSQHRACYEYWEVTKEID